MDELMLSIENEDLEKVQLLASITPLNRLADDDSYLTAALSVGNQEIIRILLESGADPNFKNLDGSTALTWTTDSRTTETLVRAGASVSQEKPSDGCTSLHAAAERGDLQSIRILIETKGGLEGLSSFDHLGYTPLHHAAASGNLDIVRYILSFGIPPDINTPNSIAPSPLSLATERGDLELVSLLVSAGANPSLELGMNPSPLDQAKVENLSEILELLQKANGEKEE